MRRKTHNRLFAVICCTIIGINSLQSGYAAYKNIPLNKTKTQQGNAIEKQQKSGWEASWLGANGQKKEIKNLGGYFESLTLEQKEEGVVEITGNEFVAGRRVILQTTHGGKVNGEVRCTVTVDHDDVLRFNYQNGSLGFHPVHIIINGRDVMMAFRVEPNDAGNSDSVKGGE